LAETMTGGRFIARTLRAYGVTHVFFMDAILRRALIEMEDVGITRILGHSEKAVAYMADGYARVSGRPGICMSQSVGAANLASGMQDPYLGQSAVIALTGRHVAPMQYRNAYQEVAHEPLFAAVTKFQAVVETPEQLPLLLRQAFREATSGTPRPVHLDIAGHAGDTIGSAEREYDIVADEAHGNIPAHRPAPDPAALRRAAEAIAKSERPVIVADRGVVISGAEAAVAALAKKIKAPVVATLDAKAVMLEDDPLFAGIVGAYARSCANHVVAEADLVIFAGSNTADQTTANWTLPKQGTAIVQIDLDPSEIGRNYGGVIGVLADPRAALEGLAAICASGERAAWLDRARKHDAEWRAEADKARATEQMPMRPERLCRELTAVLPENAILFADTGYAAIWTGTMVYLTHPEQRYFRAAGSLGWSFPASLGAKCAAPDRPVICFCGDGGFYYHLPELETARRWNIKTVTIVNDNHCLSQGLRSINLAYKGRDEARKGDLYEYRDTDFARVAQSFDCFGVTVEDPRDFAKAFQQALASDLPAVIDVKTEFAGQAQNPWVPAGGLR